MNCEGIRKVIITDYADGAVPEAQARLIKEHLSACRECREFEALVRDSAIAPFREARKESVPEEIWGGIRERLPEPAPAGTAFPRSVLSRLFPVPKPALLALSSVSICAAAALLIYFQFSPAGVRGGSSAAAADEKMQYIAYIMGFSDSISGGSEGNYPDIEEVFSD